MMVRTWRLDRCSGRFFEVSLGGSYCGIVRQNTGTTFRAAVWDRDSSSAVFREFDNLEEAARGVASTMFPDVDVAGCDYEAAKR